MLKIKAPSLSTNCLPVYVFAAQTIPCDGKTSLPLCPGKPGRCSGSKTWEGRSLSRSSILTSLPLRESRSLARIYNTPVSPGIIWWKTFQEGCQQPPRPLPLPLLRVVLGLVLVCPATRWNVWWSWTPGKITIILIVPIYLPILSFLGVFFLSRGSGLPSGLLHDQDNTAEGTQEEQVAGEGQKLHRAAKASSGPSSARSQL